MEVPLQLSNCQVVPNQEHPQTLTEDAHAGLHAHELPESSTGFVSCFASDDAIMLVWIAGRSRALP